MITNENDSIQKNALYQQFKSLSIKDKEQFIKNNIDIVKNDLEFIDTNISNFNNNLSKINDLPSIESILKEMNFLNTKISEHNDTIASLKSMSIVFGKRFTDDISNLIIKVKNQSDLLLELIDKYNSLSVKIKEQIEIEEKAKKEKEEKERIKKEKEELKQNKLKEKENKKKAKEKAKIDSSFPYKITFNIKSRAELNNVANVKREIYINDELLSPIQMDIIIALLIIYNHRANLTYYYDCVPVSKIGQPISYFDESVWYFKDVASLGNPKIANTLIYLLIEILNHSELKALYYQKGQIQEQLYPEIYNLYEKGILFIFGQKYKYHSINTLKKCVFFTPPFLELLQNNSAEIYNFTRTERVIDNKINLEKAFSLQGKKEIQSKLLTSNTNTDDL